MRDPLRDPPAPVLSVWTDGHGRCVVFVSHASPALSRRLDVARLAARLLADGLRLAGVSRSDGAYVPDGLPGAVTSAWDGADPVEQIAALVATTGAEARA